MWLPPLELPPLAAEAQRSRLEEIASTPAVALLLERARAVQPGISLGRNNLGDIVEICHRLDGMPLALELAAGQFAMLSPAAIRERLQQRFRLPGSDSAGRPRRHQTLYALVDWSYGLLSAQEQRLLCWLGAFVQGWTIDAVEAFGDALRIDAQTLLELHSGLIFKSLVAVDPTLSPARYRLLETVREFALERLRQRGEEADARQHQTELRICRASVAKSIVGSCASPVEVETCSTGAIATFAVTWSRVTDSLWIVRNVVLERFGEGFVRV
jgi:predicted ATPase